MNASAQIDKTCKHLKRSRFMRLRLTIHSNTIPIQFESCETDPHMLADATAKRRRSTS